MGTTYRGSGVADFRPAPSILIRRTFAGLRASLCAAIFAAVCIACAPWARAADSQWVYVGQDGRLQYLMDDTGNRIMDFSSVGYQGGTVPLPDYTTLGVPIINVSPLAGDNTASLQAAINQVSALPMNSNGFRGAIVLAPGNYNISAGLSINASGVVLHGAGDGPDVSGNTILSYTGTSQIDMIHVDNGSNGGRSTSNSHNIVDKVVPSGATSITVDSTAGFVVGGKIDIHRPSTANWIHDIGMDQIPNPNGTTIQWTAGSKDQDYERTITYIDQTNHRVFFDAPLPTTLDQQYGGGTVSNYTYTRTQNVGIEDIRGNGQAVLTTPTDENHANSFIVMQDTANSWASNITGQHLIYATMEAGTGSRNITLDGASSIDPISQITGGRHYPFNIEGQFDLFENMTSDNGRHDFVDNSPSRGPNVFLNGVSTNQHADSGPHQRWSTGTLFDNITTNSEVNVQNRADAGTGHGWTGTNFVVWNSTAKDFHIQSPPTGQNWIIGSSGTVYSTSEFASGSYPAYADANNSGKVVLNGSTSLYEAQLAQKMAYPRESLREYWVGDFDSYVNDGASDNVPVDSTWLSQVQSQFPGATMTGMDDTVGTATHYVPFTFNFDSPGTRVTSATLTMAIKGNTTNSPTDKLYIEGFSSPIQFNQLSFLPHVGNSDIVQLQFLSSSSSAGLSFLSDGKLNLLVGNTHTVDWADLQFTFANKALNWTGSVNSSWDANHTTQNWNDSVITETYYDGDDVTFGDGPANRNISISGTVAPNSVTVSNASGHDYTIGGGAIGGSGTLTKTGSGTLTLTSSNTYTGLTTISGGTLKISNQAALGNSTDATNGTIVTSGGTLDVNGFALGSQQEALFIAGSGATGAGALVNTGADQTNATRFVTLQGNATIGGTGRLDVRGSSSTSNPPTGLLDLNGFTLSENRHEQTRPCRHECDRWQHYREPGNAVD